MPSYDPRLATGGGTKADTISLTASPMEGLTSDPVGGVSINPVNLAVGAPPEQIPAYVHPGALASLPPHGVLPALPHTAPSSHV